MSRLHRMILRKRRREREASDAPAVVGLPEALQAARRAAPKRKAKAKRRASRGRA